MSDRLTGLVTSIGEGCRFWFIDAPDSNGIITTYFGCPSNTQPNKIGSCIVELGSVVSFVPDLKLPSRVNGRLQARQALQIREETDFSDIDLASYREIGQIKELHASWGAISRGDDGAEWISFRFADVSSDDYWRLKEDDWVEFSIGQKQIIKDGVERTKFFALEVLSISLDSTPPEEPTSPPVEPESASGRVYTEHQRKLTLKELIARQ